VQGEKVPSIKSIKFLGLDLKSNVEWEDEIIAIVRKCEDPMKIVNCAKHTWWGVDPVILIRSYTALKGQGWNVEHFYSTNLRRSKHTN
jgi:hypothetical protein